MAKRPLPKAKPHRPASGVSAGQFPPAGVQTLADQPSASASSPPALPPSGPSRRSTYVEAVAIYEKGIDALQHHDYGGALQLFQSVLRLYPEEKELHERVRLYLNVCERHAAPPERGPSTIDERLYAATLAINEGNYDKAIGHLRLVRDEDPDHDHALYMLAVAHAQRGDHTEALAHLERAVAINPENRALARGDSDLSPLHASDAFREILDAARPSRAAREPLPPPRPLRPRSVR